MPQGYDKNGKPFGFKKGIVPWNKGKKGGYPGGFTTGYVPWNKGRPAEGKQKESLVPFKKGYVPWNKGVVTPKRVREKISKTLNGARCARWKGGVTPLNHAIRTSFEFRQWRSDIFGRDDYTCQRCGVRGGVLNAHHKKAFEAIRTQNNVDTFEKAVECAELWDINNGITLCKPCHIKFHQEARK